MIASWVLAALALVSVGLNVWQWWAARRFPLHRPLPDSGFAPAVTLLKPLRGADAETEECLRSWFRQRCAAPVQILFSVGAADDPAVAIVNRLLAEFPAADARLVICPQQLGANAKVSKLVQLSQHVTHELIIISDADVRLPPEFLANVVAPLRDPEVGLVFPFYRLANPQTPAMRWEAVAINADFWSQVLQGRDARGIDFALGAVMATRRGELRKIGGFEPLVNCIADDYQLGHRIAKTGRRIEICPVVAECWDAPQGWHDAWAHQLRWARTIRVSMPVAYFFSILGNGSIFALGAIAAGLSGAASVPVEMGSELAIAVGIVGLVLRPIIAHSLHRKLSPATARLRDFWLSWLKDILHVCVWSAAFLGNSVVWRGVRYRIDRAGMLHRCDAK